MIMTEEEYLKIKQTFPNLDDDGGSARYHGEWKFKSLNSVQLKIEKWKNKYASQLEDTSDQYQRQIVYESPDLEDFLQQTKLKLAELFLDLYNQVK